MQHYNSTTSQELITLLVERLRTVDLALRLIKESLHIRKNQAIALQGQ